MRQIIRKGGEKGDKEIQEEGKEEEGEGERRWEKIIREVKKIKINR